MSEPSLETIEFQLFGLCNGCEGEKVIKVFQELRWCMLCGGSGSRRTYQPHFYPAKDASNTIPPYLETDV